MPKEDKARLTLEVSSDERKAWGELGKIEKTSIAQSLVKAAKLLKMVRDVERKGGKVVLVDKKGQRETVVIL